MPPKLEEIGKGVGTVVASEQRGDAILVVGPSWVGDMVMAQSLFVALKQRFPDTAIDVLAPAWSEPLLARMPQVRKAINLPFGHGDLRLGERHKFGKALAGSGYRQAIVLPNSLKSALVPFFAGIRQRTGWRGEMRFGLLNDIRLLDKTKYPLMIQRFAALAEAPGATLPARLPWPRLETDRDDSRRAMARLGLVPGRPVLALCPGAEFGPSKRWPEQHYAQVAHLLIDAGWQVWVMGSANDQPVAEAIKSGLAVDTAAHCHNLAGATALGEAVDLLAVADCVVSNDSGLMHIAAALARPLVVIYGSTSPGFTPPLTDTVAVLSIAVDCGPCFQRECPLGHHRCMTDVAPESVVTAVHGLLPDQPVALP